MPEPRIFAFIREIRLPDNWTPVSIISLASLKRICLLALPSPKSINIDLITIPDWSAEPCRYSAVETELHYVRAPLLIHVINTYFIYLQFTDIPLKSYALQFSADNERLIVEAHLVGISIQKSFSMSELQQDLQCLPFEFIREIRPAANVECSTLEFPHIEHLISERTTSFLHWTLQPPSRTDVDTLGTHISLYRTHLGRAGPSWKVAQHYVYEAGSQHHRRKLSSTILFRNPALAYSRSLEQWHPIMDVCYNYVVWVEHTLTTRGMLGNRVERVAMLAAFPGPEEEHTECTIKQLPDIPSVVLENAVGIFLWPDRGSIMIITIDDVVLTFRYV